MKRQHISQIPRTQTGVALIEALVAVLILSIGVLGMVGMQSASIRYEQNSWARSAVSSQVGDIADRIRANPNAAVDAYVKTNTYASERSSINTDATYLVSAVNCLTTICTPAQLAIYDMVEWRKSLNKLVPGSVGIVSGTSTTAYAVTIAWFDKSWVKPEELGNTNVTYEKAPTCTAASLQVTARNCCPAALGAATAMAGVRCVNFMVIP